MIAFPSKSSMTRIERSHPRRCLHILIHLSTSLSNILFQIQIGDNNRIYVEYETKHAEWHTIQVSSLPLSYISFPLSLFPSLSLFLFLSHTHALSFPLQVKWFGHIAKSVKVIKNISLSYFSLFLFLTFDTQIYSYDISLRSVIFPPTKSIPLAASTVTPRAGHLTMRGEREDGRGTIRLKSKGKGVTTIDRSEHGVEGVSSFFPFSLFFSDFFLIHPISLCLSQWLLSLAFGPPLSSRQPFTCSSRILRASRWIIRKQRQFWKKFKGY